MVVATLVLAVDLASLVKYAFLPCVILMFDRFYNNKRSPWTYLSGGKITKRDGFARDRVREYSVHLQNVNSVLHKFIYQYRNPIKIEISLKFEFYDINLHTYHYSRQ